MRSDVSAVLEEVVTAKGHWPVAINDKEMIDGLLSAYYFKQGLRVSGTQVLVAGMNIVGGEVRESLSLSLYDVNGWYR